MVSLLLIQKFSRVQCPLQVKGKAYWEGIVLVEPAATYSALKLFAAPPHFHIKENPVKGNWASG